MSRKKSNPIPKTLQQQVWERDGGQCQYCHGPAAHLHHIAFGGTGRKRIHRIENIVSLCVKCHSLCHRDEKERKRAIQWSRDRYGEIIDIIVSSKWSTEKRGDLLEKVDKRKGNK